VSQLTPVYATCLLWGLWIVSWLLAAVWSSRAQSRPGLGVEAAYRAVTVVGVVLLFFSASHMPPIPGWPGWRRSLPLPAALTTPLWGLPPAGTWACAVLTAAGFGFTWWARLHLGTLWSGDITRKADHRIVDTGPYALVRHPIYTGIILALFALAAEKATPAALLGAVVTTFSFWLKARFEEGFLRQELGAEGYDAYSRRTPMLVPFLPARFG
jgi:protein-S-isoprenylcysteine O-methyltransferase Ste14